MAQRKANNNFSFGFLLCVHRLSFVFVPFCSSHCVGNAQMCTINGIGYSFVNNYAKLELGILPTYWLEMCIIIITTIIITAIITIITNISSPLSILFIAKIPHLYPRIIFNNMYSFSYIFGQCTSTIVIFAYIFFHHPNAIWYRMKTIMDAKNYSHQHIT